MDIPDLTQKARSAAHDASSTHRRIPCGSASRRAQPFCGAARWRQPAMTASTVSQLRPKPIPTQSSVGNSQSQWKLASKLATKGAVMASGKTDNAFWFHHLAAGKNGGTRLSRRNRNAFPQIPTSGFFISIPVRSRARPDQSPQ